MNRLNHELWGKAVVFQPEVFQPAYRALAYRVWRVVGGYGASAITQGRVLYCRSLLTNQDAQFDGMAVERLATVDDLAAVAAQKQQKE